ncbi:MAG TPA: hypothetical protein VMV49_10455 [Candidatus Deferrimicrobium sp.]|nr:hypothetical protein [Candidatus Deferrimicrobium sp.]
MDNISGIWIFEEDSTLLFSHELYIQGSEEHDTALFQGLILSIQKFALEIGEKKTERIEMGNNKYFVTKDEETKIIFVIKTMPSADNKKNSKILNKIKETFNKKFKQHFAQYTPKQLRSIIVNLFKTDVEQILGFPLKDRMSAFLNQV